MVIHIKGLASESRVYLYTRSKKIKKESDGTRLLTMAPLASPRLAGLVKSYKGFKPFAQGEKEQCNWRQQEKVDWDA